jgi:hypothetical protein
MLNATMLRLKSIGRIAIDNKNELLSHWTPPQIENHAFSGRINSCSKRIDEYFSHLNLKEFERLHI